MDSLDCLIHLFRPTSVTLSVRIGSCQPNRLFMLWCGSRSDWRPRNHSGAGADPETASAASAPQLPRPQAAALDAPIAAQVGFVGFILFRSSTFALSEDVHWEHWLGLYWKRKNFGERWCAFSKFPLERHRKRRIVVRKYFNTLKTVGVWGA